ncbi:MAG: AAA family ATPase [Candidatus Cloacimonadota bacterium]|nr:AAA family ATPase [Candidatus Cloacimonadota bacterium]
MNEKSFSQTDNRISYPLDQAENLRKSAQIIKKRESKLFDSNSAYKIAIASGKGGVGKSTMAMNIAISMQSIGRFAYKILLVDADINLGNLDIMLGLKLGKNLHHVFENDLNVEDIIVKHESGIDFLPATSGSIEILDNEEVAIDRILNVIRKLEKNYDIIIFDCPAGIDRFVLDFINFSDETLIVITPEQSSIVDAYASIKLAILENEDMPIHVVVNEVSGKNEGEEIFDKLNLVIKHFLSKEIILLGYTEKSEDCIQAEKKQIPVVKYKPNSSVAKNIKSISSAIFNKFKKFHSNKGKIK